MNDQSIGVFWRMLNFAIRYLTGMIKGSVKRVRKTAKRLSAADGKNDKIILIIIAKDTASSRTEINTAKK